MGESSPSSLPQQWREFCSSGPPMYVAIGAEKPFKATGIISQAFAHGKAIVEGKHHGGRRVLFDFLQKRCVDIDDTSKNYRLRWMDARGQVYRSGKVSPSLPLAQEMEDSSPSSLRHQWHQFRRSGVLLAIAIEEKGSRRTILLNEVTDTLVAAFADGKCDLYDPQVGAFCSKMSLRSLVYGWYGTSASDVKEAAYGNGVVSINSTLLATGQAHGHGAHVSPMSQPYKSAMLADMDKRGECHILFCSLALGWQEVIPAGSHQDRPSSNIYDTGVDSKSDPTWYIFWSGMMHTQIVPLYIVSFVEKKPEPSSLGMYGEVRRSLSLLDWQTLERCCDKYMKKEISTPQFAEFLCVHGGVLFKGVAKSITNISKRKTSRINADVEPLSKRRRERADTIAVL